MTSPARPVKRPGRWKIFRASPRADPRRSPTFRTTPLDSPARRRGGFARKGFPFGKHTLRRQTMTELANFIRLNEDGTYLDGVVRWRLC